MRRPGVGVTVDQIAARHLGKDTSLPSLELCGEPGGMISFRTPDQPLPMESNPRKVFYGMFGQGDTKEERAGDSEHDGQPARLRARSDGQPEPQARRRRPREGERLPGFGPRDRAARAEARGERQVAGAICPDAPLGPPEDFGELLDVQFEMIALAWQTNRTRVATMKMVEEASMRTYPNLDVHEAFHPTSHWGGFPERVANLRKDPELPHRGVREVRAAPREMPRRRRQRARPLDHPVRQQHGEQRSFWPSLPSDMPSLRSHNLARRGLFG